jgi:hypothetical protein
MGGLLKKLFGSEETPPSPAPSAAPPGEDLGSALMRLTRTYWTRAPDELARLRPELDSLPWPKLLRLHHLISLELLHSTGALAPGFAGLDLPPGDLTSLYIRTANRVAGEGSPYLARPATVIQRPRGTVQLPTRQGELYNASITHLGALEVVKLKNNHPAALDFIPFKDLARVSFGPPSLFPPANVQYADGRNEVVCLPLLYGASWFSTEPTDQDGSMTRFVGHHKEVKGGIGLGHCDFMCGGVMFGLGSVQQLEFAQVTAQSY